MYQADNQCFVVSPLYRWWWSCPRRARTCTRSWYTWRPSTALLPTSLSTWTLTVSGTAGVYTKLMKGKALRKHSLHEKTAASVLLKLFISSNEWCHTTVHSMIPEDQKNMTTQWTCLHLFVVSYGTSYPGFFLSRSNTHSSRTHFDFWMMK